MNPQRRRALFTGAALCLIVLLVLTFWPGAPKPSFSFFSLLQRSNQDTSATASTDSDSREAMPETPPEYAAPTLLAYGEFGSPSQSRQARGEVRLLLLGTGEHLLRLENLQITQAPGLRVYFTAQPAPRRSAQVMSDFIDLGELRAARGDFNFVIPAEIDIHGYYGVVVYSPLFHDVFASAALTSATATAQPSWP